MKENKSIHSKVLHIGPNPVGAGGMTAVLKMYKQGCGRDFNIIPTTQGEANWVVKGYFFFYALVKFLVYMLFREIKIVHVHSSSNLSFYRKSLFIILSALFSKKIILHIHGGAFDVFYKEHRAFCDWVFRRVDLLLTVSEYLKKQMQQEMSDQREIVVLYNPIDKPKESIPRAQSDRILILHFGYMDEDKGILMILDCFERYRDELRSKVELHLGGIGPFVNIIEEKVANSLAGFVFYHGWVSGQEKIALQSQAEIYLQPSVFESLGIAIIEAMSYGSAIIASDRGGIPELVEDGVNGYLIHPKNADELYEKIKLVIDDANLRNKMIEASRQKAQRFYIEEIIQQMQIIYQRFINL